MGYTLLDQRRLDGAFQLANVVRHEVGEVGVFDMAPAGFDRIQFRGVGRQPLKLDARDGQRLDPPGGRTMNAPAIKTDDKRPTESLAQLLNEADDVLGANVLFVNLKRRADSTPCGRERHCADYAQAVVAVPGPLNRRDASEGPRAAIHSSAGGSQFHRERRSLRRCDWLFFDSRPIPASPALDGLGVLLPCDLPRFLRTEAQLVQDARQVPWMVLDAKPFPNHGSDPQARPQIGAIPGRRRTSQHDLD